MRWALVLVFTFCGCGPGLYSQHLTNDEAIKEMKKCQDAGFKVKRVEDADGETYKIVCVPQDEK